MPDIIASSVHPNLDRDKMFKELWWCYYCVCYGEGVGSIGSPLCGMEEYECCFHEKCALTEIGNPFCYQMDTQICITQQCQLPPAPGSPILVCFNMKLAGGEGWKGLKLFDWETNFEDTFWIQYFICSGCGVHAPFAKGRPLCAMQYKELCILAGTRYTAPCEDGAWCSGLGTNLCFWDQWRFPPAPDTPGMIVLFNICNKHKESSKGIMGYGA